MFALDPLERRLDLEQSMPFGDEHVVAGGELLRGHFEELALETLAQQRACTLTQVARERARVGAEHAQHEVHDAGCAAGSVVAIAHAILRERDVAEHAEQGEERERDDPFALAHREPSASARGCASS